MFIFDICNLENSFVIYIIYFNIIQTKIDIHFAIVKFIKEKISIKKLKGITIGKAGNINKFTTGEIILIWPKFNIIIGIVAI